MALFSYLFGSIQISNPRTDPKVVFLSKKPLRPYVPATLRLVQGLASLTSSFPLIMPAYQCPSWIFSLLPSCRLHTPRSLLSFLLFPTLLLSFMFESTIWGNCEDYVLNWTNHIRAIEPCRETRPAEISAQQGECMDTPSKCGLLLYRQWDIIFATEESYNLPPVFLLYLWLIYLLSMQNSQ